MVESPPPQKNDEQHPLLKVEAGGGGDGGRAHAPASATGWSVTCSPKRSWAERWPELFSACWMSGMLLGIFVLIIYGLGTMGVIRRPPLFLLTCNGSKPASEVYYHYLVEDGVDVPFKKLSEYLSYMGTQYPSLHFNVVFLIVNNSRSRYRKVQFPYYFKMKPAGGTFNDLHMFRDYHLKYHNINITIMSLNKYMALTPWRYKWKKIPMPNLLFFLRVYSVWKNGGLGMNLETFSSQFISGQSEDPAITAILRQHNNGIKLSEYSDTLNKFDRDEQNEFVSLFYGIVHQILNETRNFIDRSFTSPRNNTKNDHSSTLLRTQRDKREIIDSNKNAPDHNSHEVTTAETKHGNNTDITILDAPYRNTDHAFEINHNNLLLSMFGKRQPADNSTVVVLKGEDELRGNNNKSDTKQVVPDPHAPQVLLLYDFSIFSENAGPAYYSSDVIMPNNLSPNHNENYYEQEDAPSTGSTPKRNLSYLLSIALDGSFIAAASKQHPFLGHIISTACQRMPPRFAIQDAILTQCPAMLTDSPYCSSIYIL